MKLTLQVKTTLLKTKINVKMKIIDETYLNKGSQGRKKKKKLIKQGGAGAYDR